MAVAKASQTAADYFRAQSPEIVSEEVKADARREQARAKGHAKVERNKPLDL